MTDIASLDQKQAIFIVPGDDAQIDVRIDSETVWLTQRHMADLFDTSSDNVGLHITNIYSEGELAEQATTEVFSVVRTEGRRRVRRDVKHYNLDTIISVGYRVNSKRAVTFRQWATRVLKRHLEEDLRRRTEQGERANSYLAGLRNVELLASNIGDEPAAVLDLIERYARAWRRLLQFDEEKLPPVPTQQSKRMARLTLNQANKIIEQFKKSLFEKGEASDLFGRVRDDALAGILRGLEQTWSGKALYPNVETRAANLLYLVIKDHPFFDGNKRIGSLLFLRYLEKNGRPLLEDSALVALALLIANSDPKHKDIVIRLVIDLMQGTGHQAPSQKR
jgi:prophage maintenance system killer protein